MSLGDRQRLSSHHVSVDSISTCIKVYAFVSERRCTINCSNVYLFRIFFFTFEEHNSSILQSHSHTHTHSRRMVICFHRFLSVASSGISRDSLRSSDKTSCHVFRGRPRGLRPSTLMPPILPIHSSHSLASKCSGRCSNT